MMIIIMMIIIMMIMIMMINMLMPVQQNSFTHLREPLLFTDRGMWNAVIFATVDSSKRMVSGSIAKRSA
jgi:MFS-type transporter involved in bile tolerance (Atg22 family)